jgi:hypothetical protein
MSGMLYKQCSFERRIKMCLDVQLLLEEALLVPLQF